MKRTLIKNGFVMDPANQVQAKRNLLLEGGKVVAVTTELPEADKVIDAEGNIVSPGFIDIHCHGAFGFDTNDANEEGLRAWTKGIVGEGVTSFLATTITQSEEVLTTALENVAKVMAKVVPAKKQNLLDLNIKAVELGYNYK